MKFAVMQPYFLPYIGYWQLLHAVDVFVVYDNIEFVKKGWIHRNRMLLNGKDKYFTVNLTKDSDYLDVCDRKISPAFEQASAKYLRQIESSYRKSPYFDESYPLIEQCFRHANENLFKFVFHSIEQVREHLGIETEVKVSSILPLDHGLNNKYKLWAISEHLGIDHYINPAGGHDLYHQGEFAEQGVRLELLQARLQEYPQRSEKFVPGLSILDVLMSVGREGTREMLNDYELISNLSES